MLIACVGFAVAIGLMMVRVPIAIAMGIVGFAGFAYLVGWWQAVTMVGLVTRDTTLSYGLVVIPLFILMGNVVAATGISSALYRSAQAFMGGRPGGLALSTVAASGAFAAICGSSVATVVTMGKVALPEMEKYRYAPDFSAATIAAGATLGILIPPSVLLVIYGIITETHIGKLYAAGLIPGILGIIGYMAAVKWVVTMRPDSAPPSQRTPWSERVRSLAGVWPALLLFVIVIGGMYAGFFTAAEAAGLGATGAVVLALAKRALPLAVFYRVLFDSANMSANLFAIIIGAMAFTEFLNYTGAHTQLLDFVTNSGFSPTGVILVICAIYVLLGMLMEELSMMLLTVPLFFPVVVGLGYDPVWFGILVIVLCEVGLIAPPVGMNLFVMRSVAPDVPMGSLIRAIMPFIGVDIIRILLIALIPAISLGLPNLLFD